MSSAVRAPPLPDHRMAGTPIQRETAVRCGHICTNQRARVWDSRIHAAANSTRALSSQTIRRKSSVTSGTRTIIISVISTPSDDSSRFPTVWPYYLRLKRSDLDEYSYESLKKAINSGGVEFATEDDALACLAGKRKLTVNETFSIVRV